MDIRDAVERIVILGSPGSGKTTLAVRLGAIWDLPVVDLDALFWETWSGGPDPSQAQVRAKLEEVAQGSQWIIAGNHGIRNSAGQARLAAADAILFLDLPPLLCVWRLFKRRLALLAKPRKSLRPYEWLSWGMIQATWLFHTHALDRMALAYSESKPVIVLRSQRAITRFTHQCTQQRENVFHNWDSTAGSCTNLDGIQKMTTTPDIESARLVLQKVRMEDAADIYAYATNPNVLRYTTGTPPQALAETEAFIQELVNKPSGGHAWSIRLKNQSSVIGVIEFGTPDGTTGSLDYALAEEYWNQGLMTESVQAVLDWAFRTYSTLEIIRSGALTANPASTRVQQKCGMKIQRTEYVNWSKFDKSMELAVCAISREEWATGNQSA